MKEEQRAFEDFLAEINHQFARSEGDKKTTQILAVLCAEK